MWSLAEIADVLSEGIAQHAAQLDVEHAVRGLDALDEVALHPILADILRRAGYGVQREVRYPAARLHRKESEGQRCDLVLTPDSRQLVEPDSKATLFEPADAVALEDAFWLEVKVVSQFNEEGANYQYTSQLLSPVRRDVSKLSREYDILHAGILLILFVSDEEVATNDLGIWQDRCLKRGVPIGSPYQRFIPINDRLGHKLCALTLYPVHHL